MFPAEAPAEFCPRCGQQNHEVNLSFGHLVEETLEGLFHFDGKVFSTAGLLLFRPGVLTRRFLEGQRVPYVPPVRLYVFLSFVFFLLLSALTKPTDGEERNVQQLAQAAANLDDQRSDSQQIQQTMQRLAAATPAQRDSLRRVLADSLRQRPKGPNIGFSFGSTDPDTSQSRAAKKKGFSVSIGGLDLSPEEIIRLPSRPSQGQLDSVLRSKGKTPGFWNRLGLKRAVRWRDMTHEDGMHQLLRGLSALIFLIMPLAALLLKGAYFRQHRRYISHLIFTVHVHCFLFVYFGVALLLSKLSFLAWLEDFILLIPVVYFVVALRNFYQQSWRKTALKSLLLGFSYALTLGLALALVAVVGVFVF